MYNNDKEKLAGGVRQILALYDSKEQLHILLFKECLKYLKCTKAYPPRAFSRDQAITYRTRLNTLIEVLTEIVEKGEGES